MTRGFRKSDGKLDPDGLAVALVYRSPCRRQRGDERNAAAADACVIVPTVNPDTITPHSEAFQAVVWHLIVSHPALKACQTKWEAAA